MHTQHTWRLRGRAAYARKMTWLAIRSATYATFRRLRLPHRHNGYTAVAGNVWPCDYCGQLPAIDNLASCVACATIRVTGWTACPDCGNAPSTDR
jgi:hypothetical protein